MGTGRKKQRVASAVKRREQGKNGKKKKKKKKNLVHFRTTMPSSGAADRAEELVWSRV